MFIVCEKNCEFNISEKLASLTFVVKFFSNIFFLGRRMVKACKSD